MSTETFYVKGMHCPSCVVLTEQELTQMPGVTKAKASLKTLSVEIEGNFNDKKLELLAQELSVPLKQYGYELTLEKIQPPKKWSELLWAVPITLLIIGFFFWLQKIGLINAINSSEASAGTAFVIGLVASVSTCMAVVGGLVLSLAATEAKQGDNTKPQVAFHLSRLISFVILGAVMGLLGTAFQLNSWGTGILSLAVAVTLLILGLNLLDLFPQLKKLQPALPSKFGHKVDQLKSKKSLLTPIILGTATFFLPCGFTQSMQLYALQTGNPWTGAMIMGAFALGTLPVLALLSFSSYSIQNKPFAGVFFKAAGLLVLFFGVFNLINSLAAMGIISPVFNF